MYSFDFSKVLEEATAEKEAGEIVRDFTQAPTVSRLIKSQKPATFIKGPIGSGKTSGCIAKTFVEISKLKKHKDGKRRANIAFVRNTKEQLRDTTLQSWYELFPEGSVGVWNEQHRTIKITLPGYDVKILFRSLDRPADIRRLLSMNLTFGFLNECREIDRTIMMALKSRAGRYPEPVPLYEYLELNSASDEPVFNQLQSKAQKILDTWTVINVAPDDQIRRLAELTGESNYCYLKEDVLHVYHPQFFKMMPFHEIPMGTADYTGVFGDTNPPDEGTWVHHLFEHPEKFFTPDTLPKGMTVEQAASEWERLDQPPAILDDNSVNPDAENLVNLTPGYYAEKMVGATTEWVDTYLRNRYGKLNYGKAVYAKTFNPDVHSAVGLKFNPQFPILIGFDFGRTPAAVFKQRDNEGRVLAIGEVIGTNISFKPFLHNDVLPYIQRNFPGANLYAGIDPSGKDALGYTNDTAVTVLEEVGIPCIIPDAANRIRPRIEAVERLLSLFLKGQSLYVVDREKCPMLYTGFVTGYRYETDSSGYTNYAKPKKDEYSHIHDANQYIDQCLSSASLSPSRINGHTKGDALPVKQVEFL